MSSRLSDQSNSSSNSTSSPVSGSLSGSLSIDSLSFSDPSLSVPLSGEEGCARDPTPCDPILPPSLRGGVSAVSSRRPSFAAEFSRIHPQETQDVTQEPEHEQLADLFEQWNQSRQLNRNLWNNKNTNSTPFWNPKLSSYLQPSESRRHSIATPQVSSIQDPQLPPLSLENGLIIQGSTILTGPVHKSVYSKLSFYFESERGNLEAKTIDELSSNLNPYQLSWLSTMQLSVPCHSLYLIAFKAGRLDVFYLSSTSNMYVTKGDIVIVDADRGQDMGKVIKDNVSIDEARILKLKQHQEQQSALQQGINNSSSPPSVLVPKQILRFAQPNEVLQLFGKKADEEQALQVCNLKISENQLSSMLILNSEYQWDRRKLTFFYYSNNNQRIDFRHLVKDLFRIYKTRIWMCIISNIGFNNLFLNDVIESIRNSHESKLMKSQQQQHQSISQSISQSQPQTQSPTYNHNHNNNNNNNNSNNNNNQRQSPSSHSIPSTENINNTCTDINSSFTKFSLNNFSAPNLDYNNQQYYLPTNDYQYNNSSSSMSPYNLSNQISNPNSIPTSNLNSNHLASLSFSSNDLSLQHFQQNGNRQGSGQMQGVGRYSFGF